MKSAIFCIAACALLAGCGATLQRFNVPVPVPCDTTEPARPVMATESLSTGTPAFEVTRAALAEIDRREAYEGELRAALASCTNLSRAQVKLH
ncbi:hypothetical protein [uncultured Xylophilus sp.]|uniref:hypothetical protein n=1 Tax=uncultured Xylophilus sp. TaxID=296832 RepID=UPI0025CD69D0|nr:hypothetical protein [uncultured Xylophilus sp.]